MELALAVDELTVLLLAVAVVLIVLLNWRNSARAGDAPSSRLAFQAEPSRIRLEGETAVYTARGARDARGQLVKTVHEDVKTLYDGFRRGLRLSHDRPCLGTREKNGPFVWKTYAEVQRLIDQVGSGLQALGIPPGQGTRVGIFAVNRMEWVVTDQVRAVAGRAHARRTRP